MHPLAWKDDDYLGSAPGRHTPKVTGKLVVIALQWPGGDELWRLSGNLCENACPNPGAANTLVVSSAIAIHLKRLIFNPPLEKGGVGGI
jgi:hypothetical protein